MSKCPKCQADIPEGKPFCTQCGAALSIGADDDTQIAVTPTPPGGKPSAGTGASKAGEATEVIGQTYEQTEMVTPEKQAEVTQEEDTGKKYDISKIFETSGVCPNCYAPLEKGASSCEECGYALTGSVKAKTVSPPGEATAPVAAAPPAPPTPPTPPEPVKPQPEPAVEEHVETAPTMAGAAAEVPVAPSPPKKKKTGLILALAGIFMVVVIGGGAALYFAWPYLSEKFQDSSDVAQKKTDTPVKTEQGKGETTTKPDQTGDLRRDARDYQAMGRWDEAATSWKAYLEQHPEDFRGFLELARVQYEQGKLNESAETLQHYLNMSPADAAAHGLAARIYTRLGRDNAAEDRYLAAIAHDPDNDVWHVELGQIYTRGGFSDKAIEQYRTALEKQPENERAHWLLIQELQQTSRTEEARRMAQSYLQTFPAGLHSEEVRQLAAEPVRPVRETVTEQTRTTPEQVKTEPKPRTEQTTRETTSTPRRTEERPPREEAVKPPPPPPPSPYVTVILDGSSLNYSGKYAKVTITIAGIQQTFNSGTQARIQNVDKGSHQYSVTATFYNVANDEAEGTYSGSGMINIRYPDQRITVLRIGDKIMLK
jgi:Flp pilus assembly protein TadD